MMTFGSLPRETGVCLCGRWLSVCLCGSWTGCVEQPSAPSPLSSAVLCGLSAQYSSRIVCFFLKCKAVLSEFSGKMIVWNCAWMWWNTTDEAFFSWCNSECFLKRIETPKLRVYAEVSVQWRELLLSERHRSRGNTWAAAEEKGKRVADILTPALFPGVRPPVWGWNTRFF